jgi:hypothetical protein
MGERSSMMVTGGGRTDDAPAAPGGAERMHAVTRDDGSFELIVDGSGKYFGTFRTSDGRTSFPSRSFTVPEVEAYNLDLAFTGVPVSGLVVDKETTEPLAQAGLMARSGEGENATWVGASTTPDGRFQIEVDPGDYHLASRAPGYAPTSIDLKVGSDGVADVRIELERGLAIGGRVVDPAGRGLSGVLVQALAVLGAKDRARGGGRTRPDGTFTLEGLSDGSYTLCAGSEVGGFAVRSGVAPGGKDLTLTARPAGKVLVRVLTAEGAPVPDVWTEVRKVDGNWVSVPVYGNRPTDSNGIAEVPAPAGSVEIIARGRRRKGMVTTPVGEGASTAVEIRLTEPDDGLP